MKIKRLETHDRLQHLKQDQSLNVAQGAEDCLKKNPLSLSLQAHSPYVYLFAHPRTLDHGQRIKLFLTGKYKTFEEVPTHTMLWQPRLGKPKAQTNSYLFRAFSNSDDLEICWLLPPREMWPQYKKGNVTENQFVLWSIAQFQYHREVLERACSDDMNQTQIENIYMMIGKEMDEDIRIKKMYTKPETLEAFPTS